MSRLAVTATATPIPALAPVESILAELAIEEFDEEGIDVELDVIEVGMTDVFCGIIRLYYHHTLRSSNILKNWRAEAYSSRICITPLKTR